MRWEAKLQSEESLNKMLENLTISKALIAFASIAMLVNPLAGAQAQTKPPRCDAPEAQEYVTPVAVGGAVGAVTGLAIGGGLALGTAKLVTGATLAGAGLSGGLGVLIGIDCATTACIGTLIAGTAIGMGVVAGYIFGVRARDCAGSIYVSTTKQEFQIRSNYDSFKRAATHGLKRCQKDIGGTCELVDLFASRQCAAAAVSRNENSHGEKAFGISRTNDGKLSNARDEALNRCTLDGWKLGISNPDCRVVDYACNKR